MNINNAFEFVCEDLSRNNFFSDRLLHIIIRCFAFGDITDTQESSQTSDLQSIFSGTLVQQVVDDRGAKTLCHSTR